MGGGLGAIILVVLKLWGLAAFSFSQQSSAYLFCLRKTETEWKHRVEVENTMWEPLVQGRWQMIKTWP